MNAICELHGRVCVLVSKETHSLLCSFSCGLILEHEAPQQLILVLALHP